MKKYLIALCLAFISSAFAVSLNESSIKIYFEGYKTPAMLGTKGGFAKATFKLNQNTQSLSTQLINANIILSPNDIDMGGADNQAITDNVVNTFFKTLNNKNDIKVTVINVLEGENKGVINAKVTINKQNALLPLVYEIGGNNDFEATGRLDLSAFSNATKALKALSEVANGHLGISWNIVDIKIEAKLQ